MSIQTGCKGLSKLISKRALFIDIFEIISGVRFISRNSGTVSVNNFIRITLSAQLAAGTAGPQPLHLQAEQKIRMKVLKSIQSRLGVRMGGDFPDPAKSVNIMKLLLSISGISCSTTAGSSGRA